jgi:hypothetical protein
MPAEVCANKSYIFSYATIVNIKDQDSVESHAELLNNLSGYSL